MSPKMGGAIVITKLGRWTAQMLATGLTISGIVACSTQPAATNPELQPVEEMANNPEPVEPTTFKCDWRGGQWGTFAQRNNAVSTIPMISWNSREFGDNWKPERRCQTVSKRLTKAVANNGGMLRLSSLGFTSFLSEYILALWWRLIMETVEIHEFSTGIRVDYIAGGGYQWISRGFTGQWMNSTLAQIPDAVDQSIKNEQFAVSGAVSLQNPAIVGRVVFDSQYQEHWSVVALITYGLDAHGRDFSVYRYFLCKERDGLGIILAWINDYKQQNARMPVFNPRDMKTRGQPNEYTGTPRKVNLAENTRELLNDTIPIIVAPPKIDLAILNEMAVQKNPQSASWAYNVESINRPENFTVIQTASNAAYNRLLQNKQNSYYGYYILPGNGYTQAINSSYQPVEPIKEVIRRIKDGNRVELTDVQALAHALESITKENWDKLFDDLGAKDAIEYEIKMPEVVRLLTLRAMIIPKTLPEYLDWLSIGGKNLENAEQTESNKIQSQIITYLELCPIFKQYLVEGIKIVLNQLRIRKGKVVVVEATWLLRVKEGA